MTNECGAVGGMRIGRGKRRTLRKDEETKEIIAC
jgi:hypothetical protein